MNSATFLTRAKAITPGNGFLRTITGISIRDLTEADGDKLDNGSTPPISAVETNGLAVVVASSATFIGELNMTVPFDYDQSQDYLKFNFLVNSAGDTDTPSIDASVYSKRAETALTADLDPTISAVVPTNTVRAKIVTVDCSAQSLKAGDVLQMNFDTGGTRGTTDALNIYALNVEYRSTLAYNDIDGTR